MPEDRPDVDEDGGEPASEDDRWGEDPDEEAESEWKFDLDEVGVDGIVAERPIEPEQVSLESALFVALGVAATLGIILRMASLVG